MFGAFIKEKRLSKQLSLRQFCRNIDEDPSNWSKIERELLSAPQDKKKLTRIANALGIKKNTDDWNKLFDIARVDVGKIPDCLTSDKETLRMLPALFRLIDIGGIDKLIDIIRMQNE